MAEIGEAQNALASEKADLRQFLEKPM